ncbi:MAG: Flp pilus assembly complex ATPase component TadA [Planctomycetales bacterium]|nr:Flp pilus assembly complex ATPase component TadA [Planctomycetales bacterium]
MLRRKKKSSSSSGLEIELPPIDFKPAIRDKQEQQGVMIACRGMEQFGPTSVMVAMALHHRADQILLDCTAQGVAVRYRVDGGWEAMPPLDRATGDGVVVILKRLARLNSADRRNKQQGKIPLTYKAVDWIIEFNSQGTPTGERVLMRIEPKKQVLKTLGDLGMREKMQAQMRDLLNGHDAMFLFSAPPGHGLPSLWRIGLDAADRFVRDFHSIEDTSVDEPEQINITKHLFDSSKGETPMNVLKSLLLKQPDVLVFPDLVNAEVVSLVCEEVLEEHRFAITRVSASSAVEGLLKLLATYPGSVKQLVKAANGVVNQRLLRRLCTKCRQPFQPTPQLLQKLGIPAGRVQALYQPFIPPPPEQRVDANGKPIEIEICQQCGGRGYYGRAGIFELLQINDAIRQAILKKPEPAYILQVARENGFVTMQEEGVLAVATGMTSLQELQRVLNPPKK